MATLNKQPIAPVKGNNIAPNPIGIGGDYFNSNGKVVSVETAVVCNRVVLITTLPDDLDAGAYIALVSVTGDISRLSHLDNPGGFLWGHRLKKAVKLLIKFEKDDIPPVKIVVEKPQAAKPDVPPAPVEPQPTPAESKPETTVYKATPSVEPTVQPQPVSVEEPVPLVEPAVEPAPAPVAVEEAAVPVEPKVEPTEPSPTVQPEPQPPVDNKKSSGKMSLKDIAKEDGTQKQKNKYKPGKNSRAQMLAESQRVMQQRKHART